MVGRQAEASTHCTVISRRRKRRGRPVATSVAAISSSGPALVRSMREIDVRLEQLAERIETQRIEVVGREQARHLGQSIRLGDAGEPGIVAQQIWHAGFGHRLPHGPQLRLRARTAAFSQARRERHGVDCAGAGAADPADVDGLLLEQAIEHAPGEGAMRAAALQREIETLLSPKGNQGGNASLKKDRANRSPSPRSSAATLASSY